MQARTVELLLPESNLELRYWSSVMGDEDQAWAGAGKFRDSPL